MVNAWRAEESVSVKTVHAESRARGTGGKNGQGQAGLLGCRRDQRVCCGRRAKRQSKGQEGMKTPASQWEGARIHTAGGRQRPRGSQRPTAGGITKCWGETTESSTQGATRSVHTGERPHRGATRSDPPGACTRVTHQDRPHRSPTRSPGAAALL